jgi:hypothetical protein
LSANGANGRAADACIDDPDPVVRLLLRGLRPPALLLAGLLFLRLRRVLRLLAGLVGGCVGAPVGVTVRGQRVIGARVGTRVGAGG